jgi:sn-glycerol 3-phosphate transport system permease protein
MIKKKMVDWLIILVLIVLSLGWLVPLVWTILTSFKPADDPTTLLHLFSGVKFNLDNYRTAWENGSFVTYYLNTIVIVFGILAVQLVTITLAGYAFARFQFPGQTVLFVIFLLQLMVPVSALITPNFKTMQTFGLVDTKIAIMLPYFASAMGTFLMRQTFKQVPRELEEAAIMDGAHWWTILWRIYMSVARPAIIAFSLVSVSFHWNDFLWPLIVTSSPENQPLTVGLSLLTQMGETGAQWSMICAGTMIVILPLLLLFLIFQRQFINSFMQSGIK